MRRLDALRARQTDRQTGSGEERERDRQRQRVVTHTHTPEHTHAPLARVCVEKVLQVLNEIK